MDQITLEQIRIFADALTQPAFAVKDGIVCYGNSAFATLQIPVGTPLQSFFGTEMQSPACECKNVACTVAGLPCSATEMRLGDSILYLLRIKDDTVSVHALSHTAKSIRSSLHGMYSAIARLSDLIEGTENNKYQASSSGILQGIYQLERTAQNIDLLQELTCERYSLAPKQTDIVEHLTELCTHAEELLRYSGIRLLFELPEKHFSGNLDCTIADAVFWNALSNAAANAKNGNVCVRAVRRGNLLQLTFLNGGILLAQTHLFNRYQVAIDEVPANSGTGFGLSVIRKAVTLHGGTILFAEKPGEEVAFTVTLDLSQPAPSELHSPMSVREGLDNGLIYLSEVLPREAYDSRDIL